MSDGIYQPNTPPSRPDPLPDEMPGSFKHITLPTGEVVTTGRVTLRPNDPAPSREPVKDARPGRLLEAAGFESAEEWGNSILSRKNGREGQHLVGYPRDHNEA